MSLLLHYSGGITAASAFAVTAAGAVGAGTTLKRVPDTEKDTYSRSWI